MILQCPKCKSVHINVRNHARKVGGTIGAIAGTFGGLSAIGYGARTGATAGLLFGPFCSTIGGISGAILAGLTGGAAGGSAGLALGELIDRKILNNLQCMSCNHSFSTDSHGIPQHFGYDSEMDDDEEDYLIEHDR